VGSQRPAKARGATWLYPTSRWAIYLRDGCRCVYCGITLDQLLEAYDDNFLTVDHVKPRSKGGSNKPENLVTSCYDCNQLKGTDPLKKFCQEVGLSYEAVRSRILRCRSRNLENYREAAKQLLGLTPWSAIHPKVEDHDWLVKKQWNSEGNIDQAYWEHLRSQQELFCSKCNRPLEDNHDLEDIPF
jgi:hypothetical protein